MKKKFFFKRLIVFLIPLLVPLLILGSLSILVTQPYISKEINKNNVNLLKQTKENVELILDELDFLILNFDTNPNMVVKLKRILKNPNLTLDDINSLDTIKNFLDATVNSKPYVHSIYIYFQNNQNRFFSTNDVLPKLNLSRDISWYGSFIRHNYDDIKLWTELRQIKQYDFDTTNVVTIYRKLYSPGIERGNGIIVLNILPSHIEGILNSLSTYPDQSIMVLDENNHVLFKNNDLDYLDDIGIENINAITETSLAFDTSKNSYVVSRLYSDRYGWKYISIIPRKTLFAISYKLENITLSLLFVSLILGTAITYFITKKNYGYIKSILSILESAENGLPLPPSQPHAKDEYGYIINNIVKTFVQHNYLKVQLSERKYKLQAMELLALQSQMNPHFLFNTLQTIYWKVYSVTEKPNEVNFMIENLSDILRYSLDSSDSLVTLEEEIINTLSYIEIQKIRYKDKFDVIWDYDSNIKHYKVVKLILQPLIENSIYHGIKEKEGKSYIKIKINLVKSYLKISVIDNGLGISSEKLVSIKEKLRKDGDFSEHIGLFNTNKRLKLCYGECSGIKIRSKQNLGTAVYIYIPLANYDNQPLKSPKE